MATAVDVSVVSWGVDRSQRGIDVRFNVVIAHQTPALSWVVIGMVPLTVADTQESTDSIQYWRTLVDALPQSIVCCQQKGRR